MDSLPALKFRLLNCWGGFVAEIVICPYCGREAKQVSGEVIYPHRDDLSALRFWQCVPCQAWVGCHKRNCHHGFNGGEPLGRLANAQLRKAKSLAHRVFDGLWQENKVLRGTAYKWLAKELGIEEKDCHIGMFDIDMCNRVVELCNGREGML